MTLSLPASASPPGNPTVFQPIICQLGRYGVAFSLCTIKSENGCIRFTNICRLRRFPKRVGEDTLGWTRGSAILNSRKACGVSVPLAPVPPLAFWQIYVVGSEVRAIYINLITRNDVIPDPGTVLAAQPVDVRSSALLARVLSPNSYTPSRETDSRYMIDGKKLLPRPRRWPFDGTIGIQCDPGLTIAGGPDSIFDPRDFPVEWTRDSFSIFFPYFFLLSPSSLVVGENGARINQPVPTVLSVNLAQVGKEKKWNLINSFPLLYAGFLCFGLLYWNKGIGPNIPREIEGGIMCRFGCVPCAGKFEWVRSRKWCIPVRFFFSPDFRGRYGWFSFNFMTSSLRGRRARIIVSREYEWNEMLILIWKIDISVCRIRCCERIFRRLYFTKNDFRLGRLVFGSLLIILEIS